MGCDAIGTFEGLPKEFVQHALGHDSDGSCQTVRVGSDSPGPVDDAEALARFVFCPTHVDRTGEGLGPINETLFLDCETLGGSIQRLLDGRHAGVAAAVHQKGERIAEEIRGGTGGRPPQLNREYLGAVRLMTRDLRSTAVDAVEGRVRIYDTSKGPDDALHGDIVLNVNGLSKALRKQMRVKLFLLAERSGLFVSPHYSGQYDVSTCGLVLNTT